VDLPPQGQPSRENGPGDPGQRYLAVNADESEPGTFKDRLLMDFDPHQMLEGIAIACYACRIKTAYIFIRGEYHHQAKVLENALAEAYANGIFGGKGLLNGANTGRGEVSRRLLRPPRRGRVHLRRRDRPARGHRGQARLAPHQAALPRRQGPLRQAHHHQQRRDALPPAPASSRTAPTGS
jgi:hypothetical protein